jgi:hypothetical protein
MHGANAKRTAPEVGIGQTPMCLPLHSGGLAKSNLGMLNGGLRGRRLRETGASTSAVYSSGRRGSAIVSGLPGSRTASRTQGRFVAKLVSRVWRPLHVQLLCRQPKSTPIFCPQDKTTTLTSPAYTKPVQHAL